MVTGKKTTDFMKELRAALASHRLTAAEPQIIDDAGFGRGDHKMLGLSAHRMRTSVGTEITAAAQLPLLQMEQSEVQHV